MNFNTHPIEEVYAFLSVDKKGNEGIFSSRIGNMQMAFVTSETKMLSVMQLLISKHVLPEGYKVRLVKFSSKEVLDEY